MKILLASNNAKKAKELDAILTQTGIDNVEVLSLAEVPAYPEPIENGRTFADNALLKARAGVEHTGLITLADDSGITVEELHGCPGVLSARWAGTHGDDAANNQLLLQQLHDVPDERRQAAFVSVCALVTPTGEEYVVEGKWEGWLLREPQGEHGFGYDPLFLPQEEIDNGQRRSSACLSPEEKNAISHRARALQTLMPILAKLAESA
ncbi:RdgB/HAM1 family non-canonical purine NTP pyrophosphatase [Corynebacterium sp. HS2168-gen11]|uniref:RdgB/HAM1 family non-canonical purine NTP pyrophosphatase n=1 Tax=Corynebacterium sp. HS2168-gen11 TaxID=2974027 RepID=UPI00216ADFB3|nr:RdgB/HAM1 family non-canonical purine NTP pyrophosphatase [Corynebacterium sp. HS2168-gen11]MCS4535291.1 RdgB/HAM1 family non-canonical purine NTP pyrophosphatase [Corynebacterium sp. HS2168-gen11]